MSAPTLADIREAWADNVWSAAALTAITDKFHGYDVDVQSQSEFSNLHYGQEINFFSYLVRSRLERRINGAQLWRYRVDVSYCREVEPTGANHIATLDAVETLINAVISELGDTWGGLVDYWSPRQDYPEVNKIFIADKSVWQVRYYWEAVKTV